MQFPPSAHRTRVPRVQHVLQEMPVHLDLRSLAPEAPTQTRRTQEFATTARLATRAQRPQQLLAMTVRTQPLLLQLVRPAQLETFAHPRPAGQKVEHSRAQPELSKLLEVKNCAQLLQLASRNQTVPRLQTALADRSIPLVEL